MPWVTILILLPLAGAIALLAMGRVRDASPAGVIAALVAFATLAVAVVAFVTMDRGAGTLQLVDHQTWISGLGLAWDVGVDGISIWMILLTTVLFFLGVVAAIAANPPRLASYLALILLAEFGLLGLFSAGDLALFYVFWEAMLVPFALLIWMWGDADRRRSAVGFFIYTMVGSLLMLVAILATAFLARTGTDPVTFNIQELAARPWSEAESTWLFAAFALAFLIKVPVFPLHGWMPGAYGSAPLVVTALLSAVMSKAGVYGLIRVGIPLFPEGAGNLALPISILAVLGIVYGSLIAWRQTTMRMLVAYASLAHLGFIVLAVMAFNQMAAQGAVLQMVNHGVVTAAAFAMVGIIARARGGNEQMDRISGLAKGAPLLAGIFLVIAMASLAIPGSNSFVGEFFLLAGVFQEHPVLAVIAMFGVIYASVYMLRLYQTTMNGPPMDDESNRRAEMRPIDMIYAVPLVIAMLFIAFWPAGITDTTDASVKQSLAACAPVGDVALAQPGSRELELATKGPCR